MVNVYFFLRGTLMSHRLKYWVWLSSIPNVKNKIYELLKLYGDPEGIWQASEKELKKVPFMIPSLLR
jgi:ERCC4-type nuclease